MWIRGLGVNPGYLVPVLSFEYGIGFGRDLTDVWVKRIRGDCLPLVLEWFVKSVDSSRMQIDTDVHEDV